MKSSLILLLAFVAMAHGQQFRNQTLTDRGSTNDVVPSPSPSPSPSPIATLGRAGNFTNDVVPSPNPSPIATLGRAGNFTIHTAGNNTGNDTTTPSTSTLQPTVNATAISTNDSSLSVFPFINGQLVKLGPCTGLAIHTHDYTEHATADPNNKLPLKMVFVDPTGTVVTAEVLPGDTFVIPAGLVHYQINYGCSTSTFLATFPRPASTQLLLPSLAALPDILVFLKLTGLANGDRMGIDRNITTSLDSPPRFNTTDRASSLIPTDALANATDAATDPIPFVVNPVCAQKCI